MQLINQLINQSSNSSFCLFVYLQLINQLSNYLIVPGTRSDRARYLIVPGTCVVRQCCCLLMYLHDGTFKSDLLHPSRGPDKLLCCADLYLRRREAAVSQVP